MTAKRFTTKNIICSNYCVWDNNDKPYGNDEVVELLNELHEENKQLKQYKKALWDWNSSKIIRVNRNTGEVDLVDKELEE